jgi:DNA (cytosine-5)-methyltransferase 1
MRNTPPIRYATLCSGIGCAELAAEPLGWVPVFQSEIDPFACALLAQRFPVTPNYGDMTMLAARIRSGDIPSPMPDVLIAGTPCQSFSIAGLGGSLDDPRGRVTLELINVLNAIDKRRVNDGKEDSCVLVWENVPNVFSKADNPFGCLTGALVGGDAPIAPFGNKGRWGYHGLVRGPARAAAWRVLDAQYFGVPQRRRRVFLVAGSGTRFDPAAVLLESEGVRRNHPPRREARQNVAGTLASRAKGGGGLGTDLDIDGGLVPVTLRGISDYGDGLPQLRAKSGDCGGGSEVLVVPVDPTCYRLYGANTDVTEAAKATDIVSTVSARNNGVGNSGTHVLAYGGNNQAGPIAVATARSAHGGPHGRLDFETETFLVTGGDVTHALDTANDGKHSSEDGTGRGVPIIAFNARQDTISDPHVSDALGSSSSPQSSAIAFQTSQSGTHIDTVHATLDSNNGSRRHNGVLNNMQVRRLTVVECERLQGIPDGYTFIRDPRTRKKLEDDYYAYLLTHQPNLSRREMEVMAKDGPRYKAIGNGMAVPCIGWILERLDRHMKGKL